MSSNRRLHAQVRERIERALCGRSVSWLAAASGVPQSTLASQMAKPKFSLDVLVRVARALEEDLAYFLSTEQKTHHAPSAQCVLSDLEAVIEKWRTRTAMPPAGTGRKVGNGLP
jgi:hypothetical protein